MKISSRWQGILVAALLLLYVILAVSASTGKSVTFDETKQLPSGYFLWAAPGYRISPENGIFAQGWAALPLLVERPALPAEKGEPWGFLDTWGEFYRFFYSVGNDPTEILLSARAMIALLGAMLGLLVFFWSKKLFGPLGGLASLTLFVFCPTMLANGALVTADMAVTLGFFATVMGFWQCSHTVTWRSVLFSCAALAILVLSKMSSILILPMLALILVVRLCSKRAVEINLSASKRTLTHRPGRLAAWACLLVVHLVAVVGALWLFYNFTYAHVGETSARFQNWMTQPYSLFSAEGVKANALQFSLRFHLLPAAYLQGLGFTLAEANLRNAFLWGHFSQSGWVWFFPFAFLIKTPIASLLLFLFSFAALVAWKRAPVTVAETAPRPSLYDLSPLLILGGVYGLVSVTSHLNIGLRHIMPIYPVLFVLAGANVFWWRRQLLFQGALAALFLGLMAESLAAWPDYLAFFNPLVGGSRQGYRYLVDSSLDWGQDLPGLRLWLDENAPADARTPVYFSYFGTGWPAFYGIKAQLLPTFFDLNTSQDFPLRGGTYCVSATMLTSLYSLFPQPWTAGDQRLYDLLDAEVNRWDATANDPAARAKLVAEKNQNYWNACIRIHGDLRLTRLFTFLRRRNPDANIGGSILIYHLTDADVQQALTEKLGK